VQRLLRATPALLQRVYAVSHRGEQLLAAELAEQSGQRGVLPRVAAAQLIGAREALVGENLRRLFEGESADAVHPDATANAEQAFDLLETGLGEYCVRR
jgi:hypothetical protein